MPGRCPAAVRIAAVSRVVVLLPLVPVIATIGTRAGGGVSRVSGRFSGASGGDGRSVWGNPSSIPILESSEAAQARLGQPTPNETVVTPGRTTRPRHGAPFPTR